MYQQLKDINSRPQAFEFYTAETLWNDEYISSQMLKYHLDESVDLSSRNGAFIDRSVAWTIKRFNIGSCTRIADFGCGPGLYTSRWAEAGAAVTGIDFSARSIRYARGAAAQRGLAIDYVQQNYLEFEIDKKFDLITMIYCDLCSLSPAQRAIILGKFRALLSDGGSILLDVCSSHAYSWTAEAATCEHVSGNGLWSADEYYEFSNTHKYDEELVILEMYTIIERARTRLIYNWLQHFSRASISEEFEAAGLRIEEFYSDVAGGPYSDSSDEIAIIATGM